MTSEEVIITFAKYEIKRAIARKKVLALVAFTILLGIVPYYALSAAGTTLIPNSVYPYIWVVGIFAVGPLFLNFTAILIAAGAMSEEYEQGTAELLLSKPVRRSDYFIGKFLGGYTLFLSILALNIFLSVASAYTFFGPQNNLNIIPGLFLSPSLRITRILHPGIHARRTHQTQQPRIHLQLSRLLLKLHHKHIHGSNLHTHRQRNLQNHTNLPPNIPSKLTPHPIRIPTAPTKPIHRPTIHQHHNTPSPQSTSQSKSYLHTLS